MNLKTQLEQWLALNEQLFRRDPPASVYQAGYHFALEELRSMLATWEAENTTPCHPVS